MKNKFNMLWNKINPLDYEKNPIGALKLEIFFWLSLIYITSTYTTLFEALYVLEFANYYIPNWIIILLVIISWCRIAIKLNVFIEKDKDEK
jgi:hypothetical protein